MKNTNKTKGKYRFNIIDVLLLLVIFLSAVSIVFLSFYDGNVGNTVVDDNTFDIIYTIEQKQIPNILRGNINMGDSMFESESGKNMGHVIDFMYTNSSNVYYDQDMGHANHSESSRIDLTVKINASATKVDDGIFKINGQLISVGQEMEVRFPFYTGKVVVTAVSDMGEVNE